MTSPSHGQDRSEKERVLDWQKNVAKSTARRNASERHNPTRVSAKHMATPTAIISHTAPRTKQNTDINAQKVIGTILGAGAGAAVAYAMVRGEHGTRQEHETSRMVFPVKTIRETAIIVRPPLANFRSHHSQDTSDYDMDLPQSLHNHPRPRKQTLVSSARSRHKPTTMMPPPVQSGVEVHTGRTIVQTKNGTKILSCATDTRSSRRPSQGKPDRGPVAAVNTSLLQSRSSIETAGHGTILPNDSISQVSTNRPRSTHRSQHQHHYGSNNMAGTDRHRANATHSSKARLARSTNVYARH